MNPENDEELYKRFYAEEAADHADADLYKRFYEENQAIAPPDQIIPKEAPDSEPLLAEMEKKRETASDKYDSNVLTGALHGIQGAAQNFGDEAAGLGVATQKLINSGAKKLGLDLADVAKIDKAAFKKLGFDTLAEMATDNETIYKAPERKFSENYALERDKARGELEESAKLKPTLALTTNLAGGVAVPLPKIGKASSVLTKYVAPGAIAGGVNAAGLSKEGTLGGILKDAGVGAAVGGALGGAIGKGADKIKGAGAWLKEVADDNVATLLGATKANFKRSDLQKSLPEFYRIAKEEGILSPLATPSSSADKIEAALKKWGSKIGGLYQLADEAGRPSLEGFQAKLGEALKGMTPTYRREGAGYYKKALSDIAKTLEEGGGFDALKNTKSDLQSMTNHADSKGLNHLKKIINSAISSEIADQASAVSGATTGEAIRNANKYYGILKEMKKLAANGVSAEKGNQSLRALGNYGTTALGTAAGVKYGDDPLSGGIAGLLAGMAYKRYSPAVYANVAGKLADKVGKLPSAVSQSGVKASQLFPTLSSYLLDEEN